MHTAKVQLNTSLKQDLKLQTGQLYDDYNLQIEKGMQQKKELKKVKIDVLGQV